MTDLYLVVVIAGERVALPAESVDSVIELDAVIPVPRAAPHVLGLSALRSRVLTVIDCKRSLELGDSGAVAAGPREAAVVDVEGHHYALLVDAVEDVVEAVAEPAPVRVALDRGWARVASSMIDTADGPLLLIEAAALIFGPEARAA